MEHILEWEEFKNLDLTKINEQIDLVVEAIEETDLDKPYGVFLSGGSIGGSNGYMDRQGRKLVKTFDDETESKEYAKRLNGSLSKGEKSYYKMKYASTKLDKSKLIEKNNESEELNEKVDKVTIKGDSEEASIGFNGKAIVKFTNYSDFLVRGSDQVVISKEDFKKFRELLNNIKID